MGISFKILIYFLLRAKKMNVEKKCWFFLFVCFGHFKQKSVLKQKYGFIVSLSVSVSSAM